MRAAPSVGSENESTPIETVTIAKKRPKRAVKEYAPHEHFGSPLNICRICGEKYVYVQKPHDVFTANKK